MPLNKRYLLGCISISLLLVMMQIRGSSILILACMAAFLALLGWSVDPRDWCSSDAAAVEAAVVTTVRSGDIILLHDMSDSSVDAALAIVDRLLEQGFRFVTVSELAAAAGVIPKPGVLYNRFS